ncbi:helix-turn-helix domain-containing protein [Chryseobacterium wangxinyae]|uniref:helix-turn-helix transcriptional regulator n=1 Tax=Chryseobacterium sp. CY350 TaxID=2997336 RepID=UPI00226E56D5|nr:helix-turn-helix domain-containing protein [Chryseobacterium sp. CY350]MCY0978726.1 helix-turn-helix domain-containing protein [Chryseobacterium sp. CY350]WBZ93893.1 helix-turn-helix domain-containing protein [Chryseobacterium sp. CY350]
MIVGEKIKKYRTEKGFTQLDMAVMLDVSENTYRKIENNASSPDIVTIDKIAKFLEKGFTDLLPDECINITNTDNKGGNNGYIINKLPEKLIEQYEERIKELKDQVQELKEEIKSFKNR